MTKITFIGAERLDFARRTVQHIIDLGHYPATLQATQDRAEALQNADVVIITINAYGVEVFRHDVEIPKQYGVDINMADGQPDVRTTCGLSASVRARAGLTATSEI